MDQLTDRFVGGIGIVYQDGITADTLDHTVHLDGGDATVGGPLVEFIRGDILGGVDQTVDTVIDEKLQILSLQTVAGRVAGKQRVISCGE